MILLDAAMGTRLIARGIAAGDVVRASIDHPRDVTALHAEDVAAGSQILYTNTFALAHHGRDVDQILAAALQCAWDAKPQDVLLSIGPGDVPAILTSIVRALKSGPVMGVVFETLTNEAWIDSVCEALARENIRVALSFASSPDIQLPTPPKNVFALGCNCSLFDPADLAKQAASMQRVKAAAERHGVKSLSKPAVSGTLIEGLHTFDYAGVCCGGQAKHIAELRAHR
jgi:methionine synthase I (cobalamin-dependent)